jgi:hypothetical protein
VAAGFALATAGLALNVTDAIERVPKPRLENLPPRFWEDTHMAEALYLFGEFPATANKIVRWSDEAGVVRNRERHRHLAVTLEESGIRPWQFWRVVRENRFRRPAERTLVTRYDDSGRPMLLGLAFRLRRGIAPFLFFWLAPLMALPILAWTAAELTRAGAPAAAIALLLLFGAWPFLADALALAYSPAGFSVLTLIATIPLAVYAGLHPAPRRRGLLLRAGATGIPLAACVLARGGALLAAGGVLLALIAGAARMESDRGRAARLATIAAGCVLLAAPYVLARSAVDALIRRTAAAYGATSVPPQRHAFWFGMWSGLGDFDRSHGYQWLDSAASAAAVAAGGTPLRSYGYDPANEPIYRRLVLGDISGDPFWYAGILVRRLAATVAERKLWPWPPLSGRSIAEPVHPGEGAIDAYYSLATPPDRFGVAGHQVEIPIPLLVAPALAVLVLAARRRGRSSGAAVVLAALAVAALPLPVLVTTASAIETEAFVIVYVTAAALAVEALRPTPQGHDGVAQGR